MEFKTLTISWRYRGHWINRLSVPNSQPATSYFKPYDVKRVYSTCIRSYIVANQLDSRADFLFRLACRKGKDTNQKDDMQETANNHG